MDETVQENSLFGELDLLFKDHDVVSLEDFYFKHIKSYATSDLFPTEVIDSVFAVLCTDEAHNFLSVTKQSYERAKKVFKFNPNNVGVTDKLITDMFCGGVTTIDENFFGFINEDVAKKILSPNQWLVRCDDEGFVVTLSRGAADPGAPVYESHRVIYDITDGSYVLNFNGETKYQSWEPIIGKMFSTGLQQARGAPLLRVCDGSRIYNWREGEYEIIGMWKGMMFGQYKEYLHCFRWYTHASIIPDRKEYFNRALERCFEAHYNPHSVIDIINICVDNGVDVNDPAHNAIFNFATNCARERWDGVADRLWQLGGDPNKTKDGTPDFFIAAYKKNRASYFMRNPKLDINIKDKNGLNVAWYCKEDVDLAVFNDKNLDFHECRDGKSLLDWAIEVLKIPYIIKLVEAGIDIKRPSATNHGTYLHAFLVRSKQTKNEDIIRVVRLMVEAGIDVQSLNSLYQTPLHIAASLHASEVVRALIVDNKANPNGHQESDSTPLHVAAERGDTNVVKTLIELGANLHIRNARGQIPRDVALFGVKALFSSDEALPLFKFKAVKVRVTNPPHPQFGTNLAVIGNYLYANEGTYGYLDWWDDYGFYSIQTFHDYVKSFTRLPLNDILDSSKERTWEELESTSERFQDTYRIDTFLKVNNKLWFNGKTNYVIFDPETKTWSQGPCRNNMSHHHRQGPHFNYYENKIIHLRGVNASDITELDFTDKTTGQLIHMAVDVGDFEKFDNPYRHGVLQDHIVWFVAYRKPTILYALNIELRRNFKVFEFDFELTSSLVCFGNRFLISMVLQNDDDHKLFILDLHTMRHSLHDFDFDIVLGKDFKVIEDTKVNKPIPKGIEDRYKEAHDYLQSNLNSNKYPFGHASLAIYQTTLLMFGGRYDGLLPNSYLFAIDLSQLLPYLSLEQHAALAISKNMNKIDSVKLNQVSEDLRNKTNLW